MELKIRNEKNRKLGTIEKIFQKHLEIKIEKEKDKKYQQQEELIECRMSSQSSMSDLTILHRLTNWKKM